MLKVWVLPLILCWAESGYTDTSSITVTATPVLKKLIKVTTVGKGQVHDSLRLPARVELDQHRVAKIGSTVTGRITETRAELGQRVKKGEHLATLNSTELGNAQSDYLKTITQVNLHKLVVNRAKRLMQSGIVAASELQERETMLAEAEVNLGTATDQLRVLGMSDKDLSSLSKTKKIHSLLPITASIQGTIIERNVTAGQVVQPSDALFTIADLSSVWVVAELPEQQAHWAHKGDDAVVNLPALPTDELRGELIYVADMVNPQTRTVTVRMALPNTDHVLKPQMLATLVIHKAGMNELVVPDSAVLRIDNNDHVFVQIGEESFELREVKLGIRDGDIRRVLGGLKAGEKVVVEGGFHLNSERQRKELES